MEEEVSNSSLWKKSNYISRTLCGRAGRLGKKDGNQDESSFNHPSSICSLPDGSLIVSDTLNNCLRRINPDGKSTTVKLDITKQANSNSALLQPKGVCSLDVFGDMNSFLVCDYGHNRIRRIDYDPEKKTYSITNFAGSGKKGYQDGNAHKAQFDGPSSLLAYVDGSILVADKNNHRIRRVHNNVVSTIAGTFTGNQDGPAKDSKFHSPVALALYTDKTILVADKNNHSIRRISSDFNTVTTLCGSGVQGFLNGTNSIAKFHNPSDIKVASDSSILVADRNNNAIRLIVPKNGSPHFHVSTWLGKKKGGFKNGNLEESELNLPDGIFIGNGKVYIADSGNHCIRVVNSLEQEEEEMKLNKKEGLEDEIESENHGQPLESTGIESAGGKQRSYSNLFASKQNLYSQRKKGGSKINIPNDPVPITNANRDRDNLAMKYRTNTNTNDNDNESSIMGNEESYLNSFQYNNNPRKLSIDVSRNDDEIPINLSIATENSQLPEDAVSILVGGNENVFARKEQRGRIQNRNQIDNQYFMLRLPVELFSFDDDSCNWNFVFEGEAEISYSTSKNLSDFRLSVYNKIDRNDMISIYFSDRLLAEKSKKSRLMFPFNVENDTYSLAFSSQMELNSLEAVVKNILKEYGVSIEEEEEEDNLESKNKKNNNNDSDNDNDNDKKGLDEWRGKSYYNTMLQEFEGSLLRTLEYESEKNENENENGNNNLLNRETIDRIMKKIKTIFSLKLLGWKEPESVDTVVLNEDQLFETRINQLFPLFANLHPDLCVELGSLQEYYVVLRRAMSVYQQSIFVEWNLQDEYGENAVAYNNLFFSKSNQLKVNFSLMDQGLFWLYQDLEIACTINEKPYPINNLTYVDFKQAVTFAVDLDLIDFELSNTSGSDQPSRTAIFQIYLQRNNKRYRVNKPIEIHCVLMDESESKYLKLKDKIQQSRDSWPALFQPLVMFSERALLSLE